MKGKKQLKVCNICLGRKDTLNEHVATVHEVRKQFECDICKIKCFAEKKTLNKHVLAVHEGKKPFNCDVCKLW